MSVIIELDVRLAIFVEYMNLYKSLSSERHPTDKTVRSYVNTIRLYYETTVHMLGWIRGTGNPVDVGTKLSNPLVETYALTAATGVIKFDLMWMETAPQYSLG